MFHFIISTKMYYEQKKVKCYLAFRKHTQMVIIRVIFPQGGKIEEGLFKWPAENWDSQHRMIMPRSASDQEYPNKISFAMERLKELLHIALQQGSKDRVKACLYSANPSLLELSKKVYSLRHLSSGSAKQYKSYGAMLVQLLGNILIKEVDDGKIIELDNKLLGLSSYTSVNVHTYMRRLLELAKKDGCIAQNPYDNINLLPRKKKERQLSIKKEHLSKIEYLASCSSIYQSSYRLFLLQCYTGCRYSEAVSLTGKDFEQGFYYADKNNKRIPLFVSEKVKPLIAYLPIKVNYASYREHIKELGKKLDIDLVSHDGRRLFATLLAESCKDITVVREALGHSSVAMTERYVKVSEVKVKQAVKACFG